MAFGEHAQTEVGITIAHTHIAHKGAQMGTPTQSPNNHTANIVGAIEVLWMASDANSSPNPQ